MNEVNVRLTRFVEAEDFRWRLQRIIQMPFAPPVGYEFFGVTDNPALKLAARKCIWNARDGVVDCVLNCVFPHRALPDRLERDYGKEWVVGPPVSQYEAIRRSERRKEDKFRE